jgi:regulatory protein
VWTKKASSRFRARPAPRDAGESDAVVAGTVTAVEFQKRSRSDRVNVRIDGEFAFSLGATEGLHLTTGEELEEARVHALMERDAIERAYQRAVRFLAARPRSIFEVHRRLRLAGIEHEPAQRAIERLQREGHLDDAEFAGYWVGQRQTFRPRGPRALRSELRAKGVAAETLAAAVESVAGEQNAAACRAALPYARRQRAAEEYEFSRSVATFLLRRGFDFAATRMATRHLWETVGAQGDFAGQ